MISSAGDKTLIKGGAIHCGTCGEWVGRIGSIEAETVQIGVLHPEHTWSVQVSGMSGIVPRITVSELRARRPS